jgi:hypothetical protein
MVPRNRVPLAREAGVASGVLLSMQSESAALDEKRLQNRPVSTIRLVRTAWTLVAAVSIVIGVLVGTAAADVSRPDWAAQVDPICVKPAELYVPAILKVDFVGSYGPNGKVPKRAHARDQAEARRLIRLGGAFDRMLDRIAAVPRPSADVSTVKSWLTHLRRAGRDFRRTGIGIKRGKDRRFAFVFGAAETNIQRANELVADFGLNYCAFSTSEFPWWH